MEVTLLPNGWKKKALVNLPCNCPLFPVALKSFTSETNFETSESSKSSSYNFSPSTTLTYNENWSIWGIKEGIKEARENGENKNKTTTTLREVIVSNWNYYNNKDTSRRAK